MEAHADSIADTLGSDVRLVEYGSGHARQDPHAARSICIARWPTCRWKFRPSRCDRAWSGWRGEFPELAVQPLCADFTKALRLPIPPRAARRTVVYFPGSTIGNFESREAAVLLRKMRNEMGDAGGILVGVDLKKDPAVLEAAYNDRAGVTAEFTLNMLARLNREIGSDFDLSAFDHRAHYNPMAGRIETHIVSRRDQQVKVGRRASCFRADEAIQVEYSCKYSLEDFAALAARAGLAVMRVWTDPQQMFSVQYLVRSSTVAR